MLRKFNVKVIFCLFLFVLPLTLPCVGIRAEGHDAEAEEKDTLSLAVWNIRRFGHIEQVRCENHLKIIAEVISQYDLVVIVEFMDTEIDVVDGKEAKLKDGSKQSDFLRLLKLLPNEKYAYRISEEAGKGYSGKERYAVLFNQDLVSVVTEGVTDQDPDDKFTRNPYWITFKARNFDFTIVANHIYYGDDKDPAINRRRIEIGNLKKLYHTIQEKDEKENDILVVGDFNLLPGDKSFEWGGGASDNLWENVKPLFNKYGEETTLSKIPKLYDNIFFDTEELREYHKSALNKFHITYFDGDKRVAKRVSDHLPVTAEFKIGLPDDD